MASMTYRATKACGSGDLSLLATRGTAWSASRTRAALPLSSSLSRGRWLRRGCSRGAVPWAPGPGGRALHRRHPFPGGPCLPCTGRLPGSPAGTVRPQHGRPGRLRGGPAAAAGPSGPAAHLSCPAGVLPPGTARKRFICVTTTGSSRRSARWAARMPGCWTTRELRDMALPAIRGDYRAVETYRYVAGGPLRWPVTSLSVPGTRASPWRKPRTGKSKHRKAASTSSVHRGISI